MLMIAIGVAMDANAALMNGGKPIITTSLVPIAKTLTVNVHIAMGIRLCSAANALSFFIRQSSEEHILPNRTFVKDLV